VNSINIRLARNNENEPKPDADREPENGVVWFMLSMKACAIH
jgi:hypothetical protein